MHRLNDVGSYKADVASAFVMKRCPGVKITSYTKYVQEFSHDFFKKFQIIITGLDNVEARRWINAMVHQLVEFDEEGNPQVSTYLIDGGTEGF